MILGMKKDMLSKSKIGQDEVSDLIRVMKEYVNCEFLYVSTMEQEDILGSLHCIFGLADDAFYQSQKNKRSTPKKSGKLTVQLGEIN